MIEVSQLNKTFRVARRAGGFFNACKALFARRYDTVEALRDVGFTIRDGEMMGYIGPNGAGKSTTIKILCGILTPDSGSCVVNGRVPWRDRAAHVRDIGVVFGQRSQLWWDVPVIDSFELIRDIYAVKEADYRRALDELTALLDLGQLLKTPTRALSLGQRMRCEIAASLLHSPKILFLDEPTIGLDAVSKIAVRGFIKRLNAERRTTVLLTTHDMQDIEALATRILLIGRGRILLDGGLDELKNRFAGHKVLSIEYEGTLGGLCPGLALTGHTPGRAVLAVDTAVLPTPAAVAWLSGQVALTDLQVSPVSAEEMVARLYREFAI